MDFRTNNGGYGPDWDEAIVLLNYKRIVCLVDNYSHNIITVGQSNGMSAVANDFERNFGPISLWCGDWSYLGDGKGWKVDYEVPEMEDYLKALKDIGVDTTGIVIQ